MQILQSDINPIDSLLLKHPRDAFVSQDVISRQWRELAFTSPPDFEEALREYDMFVEVLSRHVPNIYFLPRQENTTLDSIYVRDASVVCSRGVILCNMGKPQRRFEPQAQGEFLRSTDIPIAGRIEAPGTLEGGDVVWLSQHTIAVGRSYRTNQEGINQLKTILHNCVEQFLVVDLPHFRGSQDVFHLMSIISPIDRDLALIYSPLMPIGFREKLLSLSIRLVEVPEEEFATMGCNVLALGPRKCLMLAGNPQTRRRLEAEGVEVYEYKGEEISLKGGGGPTCLTRPIQRVSSP